MGRILVTGAAGYVGSRLVNALLDDDVAVRAVTRRPAPWVRGETRVCDITDDAQRPSLASALDGVDVVVHLAGVNEWRTAQDPERARAASLAATDRVAQACRAAGVTRLVYVSTWLVYGDHIRPGVTLTEATPAAPRDAYATARLESERAAAAAADDSFDLVILRMANAVGPPVDCRVDRWSLLTNDLCRQAVLTGTMTLRTSGVQWRDFIRAGRVVDVLRHASRAARNGSPFLPPGTYNLSTGTPTRVRAMAERLRNTYQQMTDTEIPLTIPSNDDRAIAPTVVSSAALDRLVPPAGGAGSLEDAIRDTVRFCRDKRGELPR